MLNMKKYYLALLEQSDELETLLGKSGQILSAYPEEVKTFPLVVYEDTAQSDKEFSDNLPHATNAKVRVHIFTKSLSGYPTATALADAVYSVFRSDFWACTLNTELNEGENNIKHRVLDFTRDFYDAL